MKRSTREARATAREYLRQEFCSLYLLPFEHKTHEIRTRMAAIVRKFQAWS